MGTHATGTRRYRGFSSILATYYVALFSGLAVAFAAMAGLNAEATGNARSEQIALSSAESGLSILRYHITQVQLNGRMTNEEVFESLGELLADRFNQTLNLGQQQVTISSSEIHIPPVPVDVDWPGASFEARLVPSGSSYQLTVTGRLGSIARMIRVTFVEHEGPLNNAIMQNGVVSRGSIMFNGAVTLKTNQPGGCAIMSLDNNTWPPIHINGVAQLQSDIYMTREEVDADDVFNGVARWGEPGGSSFPDSDADAHVHSGIDEPEWPTIDVSEFADLIDTLPHTTIDSGTRLNGTTTLNNVYIEPNSDPRFNGTTNITGLVYIAYPNDVIFNGALNITGTIICEPPPEEPDVDDEPACSMTFNGSISSSGVENLPDTAEYAGLRDKTGTFLIAKDYDVRFNGAIGYMNGTMYTSGLRMNGATSGTVRGSIIVDRRRQLDKNGAVNLMFEVNDDYQTPAGLTFSRSKTLRLEPGSYVEI